MFLPVGNMKTSGQAITCIVYKVFNVDIFLCETLDNGLACIFLRQVRGNNQAAGGK